LQDLTPNSWSDW